MNNTLACVLIVTVFVNAFTMHLANKKINELTAQIEECDDK